MASVTGKQLDLNALVHERLFQDQSILESQTYLSYLNMGTHQDRGSS